MLIKLQSHALEKLASIAQFQQTGLATLRIKIVGGSGVQKNIAMSLNESGESLKRRIISEMNQLPINRFDRFLIKKKNSPDYLQNYIETGVADLSSFAVG